MQPARVGDAGHAVDGKAQRQGMDRLAPFEIGAAAAFLHDPADVQLGHGTAADRPLHVEQPAFRQAAR